MQPVVKGPVPMSRVRPRNRADCSVACPSEIKAHSLACPLRKIYRANEEPYDASARTEVDESQNANRELAKLFKSTS